MDKGSRNVEVLKQGQYSPLSVGQQVAIIYLGTKGLLKNVPVNKVRAFEAEYLETLAKKSPDTLAQLSGGKLSDEITGALETIGAEVAKNFAG